MIMEMCEMVNFRKQAMLADTFEDIEWDQYFYYSKLEEELFDLLMNTPMDEVEDGK